MALSARSDVVTLDPSELKELVADTLIGEDFQVATVALLVYDTIITFDKEIKYFWKIPFSSVNLIYFMNRYVGIFGVAAPLYIGSLTVNLHLCTFSGWARDIARWTSIILIDYILMIRVLALYSQDKKLSISLKTLLALEAAFKLGMIIYLDTLQQNVVAVFETISACAFIGPLPWQLGMADWLAPLAYGTLLMILALYKAAEYWRMSAGFKGFVLVKVLIVDQVVYFILVIACSVCAVLEFKLAFSNQFLANVVSQMGNPSILSLLGSRMLVNLKEAAERGQNEGTNYRTSSETMSEIGFAEPIRPETESGTENSGSEQIA